MINSVRVSDECIPKLTISQRNCFSLFQIDLIMKNSYLHYFINSYLCAVLREICIKSCVSDKLPCMNDYQISVFGIVNELVFVFSTCRLLF